jgi:hypothetical protein
MTARRVVLLALAVAVSVGVIVVATQALTPQQTNPAYAAAVAFMDAAGRGDETAAAALLDADMQAYVRDNCPNRQVSACVEVYIPPEWGTFESVIFRRASPDLTTGANPRAYDVELIASYTEGKGVSGVCIYTRMEQGDDDAWRVAGYAGFVSCGDAVSRDMAGNVDAPNRAP